MKGTTMAATLFVNLPVQDLDRSKAFFTALGFDFFGATDDMASVIISERTQVMLLKKPLFASFITNDIVDPTKSTQVMLALGLQDRAQVDSLVDKALAAGGDRAWRSPRRRRPLPARFQ
ncbi:VOC family protein [Fodinicola feengrottensis]|uniref:VOC family protein n=1 Tax=Fodinicola feengrottensis TaxID=435914 RepID=UPI002441ACAF|nr:glyoxalase [Fodinicola feengrottensis]